jgi:hypothetical protein
LNFLGLGDKKQQKINYDPEGMLTPDQVQVIDTFIQQEVMIPGHKLEEAAIKSFLTGRILQAMKNQKQAKIDWRTLPGTIIQAVKGMTLLVFTRLPRRAFGAHTVLGQNLDVKLRGLFFGCVVDAGDDIGQVHPFRGFFCEAKFAIEIPKVSAFGQVAPAFAFEVFANVVLDSFKQTFWVFAFDLQLECFFHEVLVGKNAREGREDEVMAALRAPA